jgi:hypothetical protein
MGTRTMERKEQKMKDKNWERYHSTKDILLMAIEDHLESISRVNVYDNVTNTSGDHSLMNEHMGTVEMNRLKERLTK